MSREYRTEMNKIVAQEIRQEIREFEEHMSQLTGTKAKFGNATYDDNEVTFKLTFRLQNAKPKEAVALEKFIEYANKYLEHPSKKKIDPKKIGEVSGKSVVLVGYKPKAKRYPFIVKATTDLLSNVTYSITEDLAYEQFGVSK